IVAERNGAFLARHRVLGEMRLHCDGTFEQLVTDNETNATRLWGWPPRSRFAKDAFHEYVVQGRADSVNPELVGTKVAALYKLQLGRGESAVLRLRLRAAAMHTDPWADHDAVFHARIAEADEFYVHRLPHGLTHDEKQVARQAQAGLLWSKQFYYY